LKSLGLLGITASAVLIGILLPALARLVRRWLAPEFPKGAFDLGFSLIPWFVLFYGFIMIYKLAPSRRTRFSEVWLAALAATVLIWMGGLLFLFYAANVASFNVLYGTLGGIVAFLLWIYFSSCVCVFGVCFCAAQAEASDEGKVSPRLVDADGLRSTTPNSASFRPR
jgi:YihY family inner membrane protein